MVRGPIFRLDFWMEGAFDGGGRAQSAGHAPLGSRLDGRGCLDSGSRRMCAFGGGPDRGLPCADGYLSAQRAGAEQRNRTATGAAVRRSEFQRRPPWHSRHLSAVGKHHRGHRSDDRGQRAIRHQFLLQRLCHRHPVSGATGPVVAEGQPIPRRLVHGATANVPARAGPVRRARVHLRAALLLPAGCAG